MRYLWCWTDPPVAGLARHAFTATATTLDATIVRPLDTTRPEMVSGMIALVVVVAVVIVRIIRRIIRTIRVCHVDYRVVAAVVVVALSVWHDRIDACHGCGVVVVGVLWLPGNWCCGGVPCCVLE